MNVLFIRSVYYFYVAALKVMLVIIMIIGGMTGQRCFLEVSVEIETAVWET